MSSVTQNFFPRRPFFKTALATSLKGEEPEEKMKSLGWAIIGLGSISEKYIGPSLGKAEQAHLAGVVTGTLDKAEKWKEQYKLKDSGVYSYENFDEVINNPDIDVVYIVLPNSMHKEYTLRAAKAGKHVYVEKPMAMNPQECREMINACAEAGVKLGVAYRLQFEPHHQEMIRFANEETFGKLRHIDTGFTFQMRKPGWRCEKALGGGALLDVGVYVIQATRYIFGEEPIKVSALETKIDSEKFAEVDETMTWTMQFASGRTANLICSFNLNHCNHLTAYADKGQFGLSPCYNMRGQKGWTSDSKIPLEFPQTDHFQVQIEEFSKAILEDKEPLVNGTEGLKDHLVMEAIFKSVASGSAVTVERA